MKATVYTEYGSPDVLHVKEMERPTPKGDEVLVRVFATTVNRTDCAILRAKPFIMRFVTGISKPKNPIPGTDFAGKIVSVGENITSFKVGDRVFGFDDSGLSSQAEYLTIPENKAIATIPDKITYEQAAASIEGAHYAYNFFNKVKLERGQKILVNGATGAIGSALVQLLKQYEVHVTAVCDTRNIDLVRSLGADQVVDYKKEDFTKSSEKYQYVFDAVGKSSFGKCKPLLEPGGAYISSELGWMAQNLFFALSTPILGEIKVVFPIPLNIRESLLLVRKLLEEGKFKPVIDRKYPLEEIAEAYRYVEKGFKTGNVVINMEELTNS